MGQQVWVCTFRHAQRAAYRTAISAAQILVVLGLYCCTATGNQQVWVAIDIVQEPSGV